MNTSNTLRVKYKNWSLIAYKKIFYPPYLNYNCTASIKQKKKIYSFNVEGDTLMQAVNIAKDRIDEGGFDFTSSIKLEPCVFED